MANLSDTQLMMLEQLTYFGKIDDGKGNEPKTYLDVPAASLSDLENGQTVGDLIAGYYDANGNMRPEIAARLKEIGDGQVWSEIDGNELYAFLEQIKNDQQLMNLKLVDKGPSGAYCFVDSDGQATVAFRGTYDAGEWYDNFTGLGISDTELQRAALDYIESLPYNNINIVGHSKGGNKAMYCALLSDKVGHVLSMDGQGFSQEFLEKYADLIAANSWKISSYALDQDFVNILLYLPDGVTTIYIGGNDYVNGAKNHCPINLFQFEIDENGFYHIVLDENGNPVINQVEQNKGMAYLHDFTCFVLEMCPIEKREQIGNYLGILLAINMKERIEVHGVEYIKKNMLNILLDDPETLGMVIAYLLKFIEENNMSEGEIRALLAAFGVEEYLDILQDAINDFKKQHPDMYKTITGIGGGLLDGIFANIKDGKRDYLIEKLLAWINGKVEEKTGRNVNMVDLWRSIEKEYNAIGDVNIVNGKVSHMNSTSKTFDYSINTYNTLMGTINRVDQLTSGSLSGWSQYSSEPWYSSLGISIFRKGINSYSEKIADTNRNCKKQIEKVFNQVSGIDKTTGSLLEADYNKLSNIKGKILQTAMRIGK